QGDNQVVLAQAAAKVSAGRGDVVTNGGDAEFVETVDDQVGGDPLDRLLAGPVDLQHHYLVGQGRGLRQGAPLASGADPTVRLQHRPHASAGSPGDLQHGPHFGGVMGVVVDDQ